MRPLPLSIFYIFLRVYRNVISCEMIAGMNVWFGRVSGTFQICYLYWIGTKRKQLKGDYNSRSWRWRADESNKTVYKMEPYLFLLFLLADKNTRNRRKKNTQFSFICVENSLHKQSVRRKFIYCHVCIVICIECSSITTN